MAAVFALLSAALVGYAIFKSDDSGGGAKKADGKKPRKKRDYAKEYEEYYGRGDDLSKLTPLQRQHRKENVARHAARRYMKRHGFDVEGKDVDHKDSNPLNNNPKNLRVQDVRKNRSRNKHKT